jgi:uncharacterized protein (TIGR02271 family)
MKGNTVITQNDISRLNNADAYDSDGDKIGSVGQVFLDAQSGEPEWVTVKTGLFGTKESFVPLQGATFEGDRLTVQADKARVKDAPRIDTDKALSYSEEEELYTYYGLNSTRGGAGTYGTGTETSSTYQTGRGTDTGYTEGQYAEGRTEGQYAEGRTEGQYAEGRTEGQYAEGRRTEGDNAMTRSEERLVTDTKTEQTGKARLRKYVVTEQQQVNVPVSREEVRLEREPITDANAGGAFDGPAITESEHEVTLHAERPVVDTEAVPVERVRLDKETVRDEERVSGEVRKEQIEFDGPEGRRNR